MRFCGVFLVLSYDVSLLGNERILTGTGEGPVDNDHQ